MSKRVGRIELLTGAGLLLFGGLSARLYAVSVWRHEEFALEAERRSRRVEIQGARRGSVVDRNGRPLAIDRPSHDVILDLTAFDPTLVFTGPLAYALEVPRPEAQRALRAAQERAAGLDPDQQRFVLARVSPERVERLKRRVKRIPRLRVELDAEGPALVTDAELLRVRAHVLARLAALVDRDVVEVTAELDQRIDEIQAIREREERLLAWSEPHSLVSDASFAVVARVSERSFELPGVEIVERFKRRFPFGDSAVHVIGFLGKPSAEERRRDLKAKRLVDAPGDPLELRRGLVREFDPAVRLRDETFGRMGIERRYDASLRGRPGARVVVRDVRGRERQTIVEITPKAGRDVALTLDIDIQRAVEAALDRAVAGHGDPTSGGAAALFDVHTGEILTLASSPRFDPNRLPEKGYFKNVRKNPHQPQRHRALSGFAPGSTWKVLSSFALTDREHETGLAPDWTTVCTGAHDPRRPRRFRCEGIHGRIGMARALERSCNVFFFHAADRVGLSVLARWGRSLGMGARIGRGLSGEAGGLVPHPTYKADRLERQRESVAIWTKRLAELEALGPQEVTPEHELHLSEARKRLAHAQTWERRFAGDAEIRPGDVRNAIIGQGDVLANTLQVATIAALVATEGQVTYPRILMDQAPDTRSFELDPEVLSRVKEGMRRVVTRGTASAHRIGLRSLDAAGKTGTAERAGDHPNVAWFMGYYPASDPQVAFAVVVDRTRGHGGDVCGPVTRSLIDAYEASRKKQRAAEDAALAAEAGK